MFLLLKILKNNINEKNIFIFNNGDIKCKNR